VGGTDNFAIEWQRLLEAERRLQSIVEVPTLAETARVKAWLLVERDTTRDFVDTVALLEQLGTEGVARAFQEFDVIYERAAGGEPPLVQLIDRLAGGRPADRDTVDLSSYKGLRPPWTDWSHVRERGRHWAIRLAPQELSS
jgi:hypothetical protein